MRFRSSFASAVAVAVAAVAGAIAIQPVEAATFTWRTGANGTGTTAASYGNPNNWVGGIAATSAANTTLAFVSNTTSNLINTSPGNSGFNLGQLLLDGTTTYRQGTYLNFASGATIVNNSSVLQEVLNAKANGTGLSITALTGTLAIQMNNAGTGQTATVSGLGVTVFKGDNGNVQTGITGNGGGLIRVSGNNSSNIAQIYGDVTLNGGSFETSGLLGIGVAGSFTAASGVPVRFSPDAQNGVLSTTNDINYGGMALGLDLTTFVDVTTGYSPGDPASFIFSAGNIYTGNLSSLTSTASSGPYVGLTWLASGSNWLSSQFNGNQQLEFRPADGAIYVVPEPAHMTLVAGLGAAAFGAWRLRRRSTLRRDEASIC